MTLSDVQHHGQGEGRCISSTTRCQCSLVYCSGENKQTNKKHLGWAVPGTSISASSCQFGYEKLGHGEILEGRNTKAKLNTRIQNLFKQNINWLELQVFCLWPLRIFFFKFFFKKHHNVTFIVFLFSFNSVDLKEDLCDLTGEKIFAVAPRRAHAVLLHINTSLG